MTEEEFQDCLTRHAGWVARFRATLAGECAPDFSPALIANYAACPVGHWLVTHDSPALANPLHRHTFNALHQTFHEVAAEIAAMILGGSTHDAIGPYLEALESLARQLVTLEELNRPRLIDRAA